MNPKTQKRKAKNASSKPVDRCTAYAQAVINGEIVAGPFVRGACQRHLNDLKNAGTRGLYYDEHEAAEAIAFFEECLCLNGGQFEGLPFILFPWQSFIIGSLFGWKRKSDGMRRFRVAFIETPKGPLALDTPIATVNGWTTMGEIKTGDIVFNSQGKPTPVVGVSPIFTARKCYRLRFSDGAEIVADAEHEWYTAVLRNGKRPGPRKDATVGEYEKKNTAHIAATLSMPISSSRHPQAKWNHRVEVSPALDLPDIRLPIDPYTLGAWLGDGDSDAARITCEDDEIMQYIADAGYILGKRHCRPGNRAFRQAFGLQDQSRCARGHERSKHANGSHCRACDRERDHLKRNGTGLSRRNNISMNELMASLGLFRKKQIITPYFRAGVRQRLSLLQGLMDTDGHVAKGGKCEITLCDERLANDVLSLLRSLGYKCVIRESEAKLNGKTIGPRWRIGFQAYRSQPPVRLARKFANLEDEPRTRPLSRGRMIVACDQVESVPVRCITVASEDHMFLAGHNLVPTCNSGKSPLAAGIGLKGLVADNEPRAEVYAAATYKDQAMVLFRDAMAFYDQSPELQKRLVASGTGEKRWSLSYPVKGSFFRPISSEKKGQSGPRPHMALLDEIHEHRDGTVIEMLRAGFKFRRQPLSFMITNSGHDKTTVGWEYHDMGTKIACEQLENDEFFAYICALDEEDLEEDRYLEDESLWAKVNPSLDAGIPGYEYIRGQIKEARGMPSKMSTVKRLCFCIWTEAENPAISREAWMACQDKDYPVDILTGRRAWGGLDLSAVNDLTAFALMFEPREDDPLWRLKVWFWIPGIGIYRKEETDHVPYIAWRDAGYINAIDRKTVDYEFVITELVELCSAYNVQKIAFDRWKMKDFEKDRERLGATLPEMVEFGQGYQSMSPAIKIFETKFTEETMRHDGNPCLTWCASNVVAVEDAAENKKYDKSRSIGRIDGIIAAVMACGILEEGEEKSVYEGMTAEEIKARMAF